MALGVCAASAAVAGLVADAALSRQQTSVHVPFFDRLAEATGQTPQPGAVVLRRRAIQMMAAALVWILIVAALARPQRVGEPVTHEVSARDLILAVDISGSMEQIRFPRRRTARRIKRLDGVKSCSVTSSHGARVTALR